MPSVANETKVNCVVFGIARVDIDIEDGDVRFAHFPAVPHLVGAAMCDNCGKRHEFTVKRHVRFPITDRADFRASFTGEKLAVSCIRCPTQRDVPPLGWD